MRAVSFGEPGRERPGVAIGDSVLDLLAAEPAWPGSWRGLLEMRLSAEVAQVASEMAQRGGNIPLSKVRLGAPIPEPSKIIAIGLNYRDHAEEQNKTPPEAPLLFAKAPSCLIGPYDSIVLPPKEVEGRVDAEAELCIVVGKELKDASPEEARDAIFGYMAMNDVSGRRAQYADRQWFRGKSFDTFGPCGPWIVTTDELSNPSNLAVEADWNGMAMQRGNTGDLLFDVETLLVYISKQMRLLPGDLISTGTPAGVGVFRDPPVFLKQGDTVEVRIEGIGSLVNTVE